MDAFAALFGGMVYAVLISLIHVWTNKTFYYKHTTKTKPLRQRRCRDPGLVAEFRGATKASEVDLAPVQKNLHTTCDEEKELYNFVFSQDGPGFQDPCPDPSAFSAIANPSGVNGGGRRACRNRNNAQGTAMGAQGTAMGAPVPHGGGCGGCGGGDGGAGARARWRSRWRSGRSRRRI